VLVRGCIALLRETDSQSLETTSIVSATTVS
jgi:hypothetical protein